MYLNTWEFYLFLPIDMLAVQRAGFCFCCCCSLLYLGRLLPCLELRRNSVNVYGIQELSVHLEGGTEDTRSEALEGRGST